MAEKLGAWCLDCHKPYDEFGLDTRLPDEQWEMIHPDKHGVLCANCIVQRASKIEEIALVHIRFETWDGKDG